MHNFLYTCFLTSHWWPMLGLIQPIPFSRLKEASSLNVLFFNLFKVREPFSVMSLLKSPMGLMVGFMVLMVFVMPKLMENIGIFHLFYTK